MEDQHAVRRLAAIFCADVKDYTGLMQDNEMETVATISAYREVMFSLIEQHHGRVVDSPGDNILAEFSSVVDALQGAVAIQKELKTRNDRLQVRRRMLFRIGINLGDIIVKENRIYGDGVNIAARLESFADPGGICISRTAYDQIEDKLPLGFEYLGEKTAKNLKKPLRAYKVNLWPETFETKIKTGHLFEKGKSFFKPSADESDPSKKKDKPPVTKSRLFMGNLKAYLGVIGLLLLINILTYSGVIWVHWPVMGWGILLYLHWLAVSFSNKSGR
jgi:class 3 adenylate cyclase